MPSSAKAADSAPAIPNVLAERYASPAMRDLWSQSGRILLERDFWIAVMKAQKDLGVPIPGEAIKDYEKVKNTIDLAAIAARERVTLHDVKARLEEFSELAHRQFIHLGLTSRDLTENVEQLQVARAMEVVRFKTAAALLQLARRATEQRDTMLTGRTHNVPAQPTTLGKRLAMFGQELLLAFTRLEELQERYPVRGRKGAVGTQLDQLTLLGGDSNKVTVSAVGTWNDQITVTAGTSTAPYAGQTHVAWWSTVDLAFQVALVVGVSGSSGAWVLSLDRPFVASDGTGPTIGDYICPAAQNLLAYGTAWRDLFRSLGPGEMTTDVNRLPRAKRHPYATDEDPHSLNSATLGDWAKRFREISGYSFGHAPQKSPSVPLLVSQPPNILKPRCFAIYAE